MKIERIETFLVAPRWLFCRVETDDGLVGWGEPVVEGRAEVVRSAVEVLSEYLIGADPLRIEQHWQVLTKGGFYRGGPILSSAVAGLDQALWDIAGQAYGAPVHALLGGPVRDRVRIYSWIGGDEPGEVADAAAAQVAAGLTGVKMNACGRLSPIPTSAEVDEVVGRVAAAREVLGPDRDIAVDFHGRAGMAAVRRILPELAALRPFFVEEPVLPDQAHHLRDIVASTPIPVATGERLYGRSEFLGPLQAGVAVVQPDLSHAGGISEVRRIAALAETYGALLAPHCPLGPISLAASLQVAFATPNFLIQEQSIGIHYNAGSELLDYLVDPEPFRFVDGHIARLDRPGLGITVDESAVRKAAQTPHAWRNPVWQHADGSFAEW
ncbi:MULTISPECIES: galactonate dehydratase [Micromonospora]|uniref:Galactonate dehydratase n=1 Tax=Micromonospora ureilytica TaxID=709868 RepID=A0ABS0JME4_9ACTN|nr:MULTISPECIES: galactonate dehydratase [Micromonospora]MBG6068222.1 galactonate dehydratase [Micromonospora ureilytica]MBQ1021034.1 galactonate dehydratase [Micromonospora sp. D93]